VVVGSDWAGGAFPVAGFVVADRSGEREDPLQDAGAYAVPPTPASASPCASDDGSWSKPRRFYA